MHISRVHIGDQTYVLTPGEDIPALKAIIVAALRPGGGFVDFRSVSRGLVSVLITPGLPIRFEMVEQTEEPEGHTETLDADDSPDFDVEYFLEQFSA